MTDFLLSPADTGSILCSLQLGTSLQHLLAPIRAQQNAFNLFDLLVRISAHRHQEFLIFILFPGLSGLSLSRLSILFFDDDLRLLHLLCLLLK